MFSIEVLNSNNRTTVGSANKHYLTLEIPPQRYKLSPISYSRYMSVTTPKPWKYTPFCQVQNSSAERSASGMLCSSVDTIDALITR